MPFLRAFLMRRFVGQMPFMPIVQMLLAIPVLAYSGRSFYRNAWRSVKAGMFNMDVLVVLGVSSAFFGSDCTLQCGLMFMRGRLSFFVDTTSGF